MTISLKKQFLLVEDLSPQLGGNLDQNGFDILINTSGFAASGLNAAFEEVNNLYAKLADNETITGVWSHVDDLKILVDNKEFLFGAAEDAGIMWDGSKLIIDPTKVTAGSSRFIGKIETGNTAVSLDSIISVFEVSADYSFAIQSFLITSDATLQKTGISSLIFNNSTNDSAWDDRGIDGVCSTQYISSITSNTKSYGGKFNTTFGGVGAFASGAIHQTYGVHGSISSTVSIGSTNKTLMYSVYGGAPASGNLSNALTWAGFFEDDVQIVTDKKLLLGGDTQTKATSYLEYNASLSGVKTVINSQEILDLEEDKITTKVSVVFQEGLKTLDNKKLILDSDEDSYLIYNSTTSGIEVFINGSEIFNFNNPESISKFNLILEDEIKVQNDNKKLYFGAADDASIYWNGTNLIIDPTEISIGRVNIKQGLDIGPFSISTTLINAIETIDPIYTSILLGLLSTTNSTSFKSAAQLFLTNSATDNISWSDFGINTSVNTNGMSSTYSVTSNTYGLQATASAGSFGVVMSGGAQHFVYGVRGNTSIFGAAGSTNNAYLYSIYGSASTVTNMPNAIAWAGWFDGDVQITDNNKLILGGSATIKGDSYLIYNSVASGIDIFNEATEVMNLRDTLIVSKVDFLCETDLEIDGVLNHDGSGVGFFNVPPVIQQTNIPDPSGGATIDTEARSAINDILGLISNYGLMT